MRYLSLALILTLILGNTSFARDAREQRRIDYLIDSLSKLEGASFIRNGQGYSAADAQQHLRRKLDYAGERVQTAQQFIKYCASQSSLSRQPYRIRLANGQTVETATFFEQKLKEFKP